MTLPVGQSVYPLPVPTGADSRFALGFIYDVEGVK